MRPGHNAAAPKATRRQHIRQVQKQKRREQKQVGNFLGPLTGKKAAHMARAQANYETKPLIRGIRGELAGSRKRQGDLTKDYSALGAQFTNDVATNQQQADAANAAITQRLAAAGATDQAGLAKLAAADADTAKLLGFAPNTSGQAVGAAAAASRQKQAVALTAPITAAGASQGAYLRSRAGSVRERGIEAKKGEVTRRQKIREDLRAAQKQRGQSATSTFLKLREGDQDYKLGQEAFNKEKPYEKAVREQSQLGLQGTLASARAQEKSAATYAGADKRTAHATEVAARQGRKGHQASARGQENAAKTYGSKKGAQHKEATQEEVRRGVAYIEEGFPSGKQVSEHKLVSYLLNRGVSEAAAHAAVRRLAGGK